MRSTLLVVPLAGAAWADLASLALFWDRAGDDRYHVRDEESQGGGEWGGTPPFGSTTVHAPFPSCRDDLPAIGLLLDSGGDDACPEGNGRGWTTDRREGSLGRESDRGRRTRPVRTWPPRPRCGRMGQAPRRTQHHAAARQPERPPPATRRSA